MTPITYLKFTHNNTTHALRLNGTKTVKVVCSDSSFIKSFAPISPEPESYLAHGYNYITQAEFKALATKQPNQVARKEGYHLEQLTNLLAKFDHLLNQAKDKEPIELTIKRRKKEAFERKQVQLAAFSNKHFNGVSFS